jgi:hypothetical protein
MNNIYFAPSFYAHIINGFFIFIAIIMLYKNYSKIIKTKPYNLIILVLFFSICIGVHGLSHMGLEKNYNYNPLVPI